jgi:hypothetical protein
MVTAQVGPANEVCGRVGTENARSMALSVPTDLIRSAYLGTPAGYLGSYRMIYIYPGDMRTRKSESTGTADTRGQPMRFSRIIALTGYNKRDRHLP